LKLPSWRDEDSGNGCDVETLQIGVISSDTFILSIVGMIGGGSYPFLHLASSILYLPFLSLEIQIFLKHLQQSKQQKPVFVLIDGNKSLAVSAFSNFSSLCLL
jgi:hypothetical protein